MTRLFLYVSMLAAALCGCIHSAPVPDEVKSSAPGFGSSDRSPEGLPLSLPNGIAIVDRPYSDGNCTGLSDLYGVGEVRFCMQLSNNTGTPAFVTIPAGTVFISENIKSPNGLIVKKINIRIPAHSAPVMQFMTCSINQDRKAPAATFGPQPILTNHYSMPELLSLLETKRVNAEDYDGKIPPAAISAAVQAAVHELAHTGRLSASAREKLAQLPDQ